MGTQMTPVLLWTDALIFLLLITIVVGALYARGKEHLRAPWRQVIRSRMGMAALVVLTAYAAIGLLDSMHYRKALPTQNGGEVHYSGEVLSVLDTLMGSVRENVERTYSAPFAFQAYSKEVVQLADGQQAIWHQRPVCKPGL